MTPIVNSIAYAVNIFNSHSHSLMLHRLRILLTETEWTVAFSGSRSKLKMTLFFLQWLCEDLSAVRLLPILSFDPFLFCLNSSKFRVSVVGFGGKKTANRTIINTPLGMGVKGYFKLVSYFITFLITDFLVTFKHYGCQ